jgi:ElaB/YqjD/DUF883 family membrane-anchored ribosome-binding protein
METNELFSQAGSTERSSQEIQQDITAKEQEISESVLELSERIQEKFDWREYIAKYPYAAVGIAAGVGVLASRLLPKPPTVVERLKGAMGEEVSHRLNRMLVGTGKSVLGASLWGLASTLAMGFVQRAVSKAMWGEAPRPPLPPCQASTMTSEQTEQQVTTER